MAQGAAAELYALGPTEVLKLFRAGHGMADVRREAEVARLAATWTVPTPAVHGVVTVGKRVGIRMERVRGTTLTAAILMGHVSPAAAGRLMAELHAQVHAVTVDGLSALRATKEVLGEKIAVSSSVPEAQRIKWAERLGAMPDGDSLSHGDLQPENVLVSPSGRAVVIDWALATGGDPLADVAQTLMLLTAIPVPPHVPGHADIESAKLAVAETYLERYLELRHGRREDVHRWLPFVAAARISLGVESEKEGLTALIEVGRSAGHVE